MSGEDVGEKDSPEGPERGMRSGDDTSDMPGQGPALRVMTYNILNGGVGRLEALATVIADARPDLVGLQEVRDPQALDWLAARLGMHCALAQARWDDHVGVLARWPITVVPNTGPLPMRKAMLETRIDLPDGTAVRFFVAHLASNYQRRFAGEGTRVPEIRYVLSRMMRARASGEPQVLVGDFNSLAPGERLRASLILSQVLGRSREESTRERLPGIRDVVPRPLRPLVRPVAWSLRLRPIAALFDAAIGAYVPRRVVRTVRQAGYVDCYAALRPSPRSRGASCPAPAPAGRIDYIFASPELAKRLITCDILDETPTRPVRTASDHRPVLATFALESNGEH